MSNDVSLYTPEQQIELETFLSVNLGVTEEDYVVHEIESTYIHTDVTIINNTDDIKMFASTGMGAGTLNTPTDEFKNIELMAFASADLDPTSERAMLIAAEINAISKFPFRENTWFGPGHTINASEEFRQAFGYEYFLFMYSGFTAEISGIGDVPYLVLIPLYANERDCIVETGDATFLDELLSEYGADILTLDNPRERTPV